MVNDEGFTLAEMLAALFVVSLVMIGLANLTRQYASVVQVAASAAVEHRNRTAADVALARLIFTRPAARTCSDQEISGSCVASDASVAPCSVRVTPDSARYMLTISGVDTTTSLRLPKQPRLQCTTRGVAIWLKETTSWRAWSNTLDLGN